MTSLETDDMVELGALNIIASNDPCHSYQLSEEGNAIGFCMVQVVVLTLENIQTYMMSDSYSKRIGS